MIIEILIFLVILSILILVHELGHFIAARRAGVWVEEFGLGLPPRIIGRKWGQTLYSINLLPFGGFVRLHGENSGDLIQKPKKAFMNKSIGERAIIITAGVIMNFILAVFAFSLVYSIGGVPRKTDYVNIVEVRQGSPAEESGLVENDLVKKVDNIAIKSSDEFIKLIDERKSQEVKLTIERGETVELVEIVITPRKHPPEGEGPIGVVITDTEIYYPPAWQRPILGVKHGIKEAIFWGGTAIMGFFHLIGDLFGGMLPKDIAGPAGLFVITSEVAKTGILPLINWLGIISVNLAILNIFPFPALDGGRLLFIGIEKLFGRKLIPKAESWLHTIGIGILVLFLLAVTIREIKLISSLGVSGYLDFLSGG